MSLKYDPDTAQRLKNEGNEFFSKRDFTKAVEVYSKALDLDRWPANAAQLRSILLSNRAACYLSLLQYEECITDCTDSIELQPTYAKAFYRRSQAYEKLGKLREAFNDVREVMKLQPNDSAATNAVQRILKLIEQQDALETRKSNVAGLISLIAAQDEFSKSTIQEREEAIGKLVIQSKELDTINSILRHNGLLQLSEIIKSNDSISHKLKLGAMRVVGNMCATAEGSQAIQETFGLDFFLNIMTNPHTNPDIIRSALPIVSHMVSILEPSVEIQCRPKVNRAFMHVMTHEKSEYNLILASLNDFVKLPWKTRKHTDIFVNGHLGELLALSSLKDFRNLISVGYSKIIDACDNGKENEEISTLKRETGNFIYKWITSSNINILINGLSALSSILLARMDLGVEILIKNIQHISDRMEEVLRDERFGEVQLLVAEIMGTAAGQKDFQKVCEPEVLDEIISFLRSDNPEIQVRVAAATSKLATGNDRIKQEVLKDHGVSELQSILSILSTQPKKIEEALKDEKSKQVYQWAVEALSFLSLNGPVKETIASDQQAIEALFNLARSGDKTIWFGVASIFANIARYIRKDEVAELTRQLQKMASGQKIGKVQTAPDILDDDPAVKKRCDKLVEKGIVGVLMVMAKEDDEKNYGIREVIAETFVYLATTPANRGKILQTGALKTLVSLATHGTAKGKKFAAHALAKIGISVDPNLAFHDQFATRIITPLMDLLRGEEGLETFESLMALTNLATLGDDTIKLILRNDGLNRIEMLQLSQHEMIQRASCELLCNTIGYGDITDLYRDDRTAERRLKLWGALSRADDFGTQRACSGVLAMLSSDEEIAEKIMAFVGPDVLLELLIEKNPEVHHRAIVTINNLVQKEARARVFSEKGVLLPILQIIADSKSTPAKETAAQALETLSKFNLVNLPSE